MKAFTFTYLHVPPNYKIQLGLDTVEKRTVTIHAKNKVEAKRLFDLTRS
jgi:hypothetical protein